MLQCGYIPSSLVSSLSGPRYTPPTGAQEDVNPRTSVLDDLSSSLSFGITCIQVIFFCTVSSINLSCDCVFIQISCYSNENAFAF